MVKVAIAKLPKNIPKTKMFRGRKYRFEQLFWSKDQVQETVSDIREGGHYYATFVPVMYKGERKYALYVSEKKYALVTKKTGRK
jgi:hypothetical protein